jgi:hypothetical protein
MAPLAKRATAAVIDMALIGVLCFALLWATRLSEPPRVQIARTLGAVLGLVAGIEMLSGWSAGKHSSRLIVRNNRGIRASMIALIIRGIVRWLPVALFLPALVARDNLMSLVWWGISMTAACCYVATAYLTLMRSQTTPFDTASGTVVTEKAA